MKSIRFVKNWLVTIIIGALISGGVSLITSGSYASSFDGLLIGGLFLIFSTLASLPYIFIMMAFARSWSKKQVSRKQFHLNTLLVHFAITVLTILVINIAYGNDYLFWPSVFIIFGYFALDSIVIHYSINKHYGEEFEENVISENPELLDDFKKFS